MECPRVLARGRGLSHEGSRPMRNTTPTQKSESTETTTVPKALAVEKRTRRACEESMAVDPYGGGTGMFDVYSESGNDYVVDLRDDVCSCPDFIHREPNGGCKHIRRVRLEFGIDEVPEGIRSDHSAPMDVELARRRRGIDVESDESADSDPTIEKRAVRGVEAMTDGGENFATDDRPDGHERGLKANALACDLMDIEGAGADFEVFCALVKAVQDGILELWDREERR